MPLSRGPNGREVAWRLRRGFSRDAGAGIPDDIIGKVFEPFFSTKQNHKGSGLGLSQVHGFAHQSNGTVAIESHVGEGTVVTLYLPRSREGPAPNSPKQVPSVPGGTALLVGGQS